MWIETTEELEGFCRELSGVPYITVDTEFVRVKTYRPVLCLVQIGYEGKGAVIDVMSERMDPTSLKNLLLDPNILKVFHAAAQDLEIFSYVLGQLPTPLFDTQIAAAFCGLGDQVGYAGLVQSLVGSSVDKSSQNTDWARRPLTPRQIEYALGDVTHLCRIYRELVKRLEKLGRESWVEVEFRALEDPERYHTKPREAYKRVKIRRPKRRQLSILREVAAWREETAIEKNLPRHWVLKDDALVEIALNAPRNERQLQRVRNLNLKSRQQEEILDAIQTGVELPEEQCPPLPVSKGGGRVDDTLIALLQALLKLKCDGASIATRLVAARSDLESLAQGEKDIPVLQDWRREIFGDAALELLEGRLGLAGNGSGGVDIIIRGES